MKKLVLLFVSLLWLAGCGKTYSWNQRITLYFQSPDGPVVASSVTHVDFKNVSIRLVGSVAPVEIKIYGEATMVALGEGKYLFVLMPSKSIAFNIFRDLRSDDSSDLRFIRRQIGKDPVAVDGHGYQPSMVYFSNIGEPSFGTEVTPNNFTEVLGLGYAYEKMTFEITKDSVSESRIQEVLLSDFFVRRREFFKTNDFGAAINSPELLFALRLSRDRFFND